MLKTGKMNQHILSISKKLLNYLLKPKYSEIQLIMVTPSEFSESLFDITILVDGIEDDREIDIETDIHKILQYIGSDFKYNLSFEVI